MLKELGEHPDDGGKMQVLSGRYGPYVKHGDVNATLPRGKDPAALSVDEAVELIAERAAKGPSKKKKPVRKAAGEGQAGGERLQSGQGRGRQARQGSSRQEAGDGRRRDRKRSKTLRRAR